MKDFKDLKVWEKAHRVVLAIYKQTPRFPKEELYGLTSQIRRAAISMRPTSRKDVAGGRTANYIASSRLRGGLRARLSITCSSLTTSAFPQ